jgi:toxin-antitoxin system PIN domain toxin
MKIVDVNILVYVVNRDAVQHDQVREWWESTINSDEVIGIPWIAMLGFLRLITHPRLNPTPMTSEDAVAKAETWMGLPQVRIIQETENHWSVLRELLVATGTAGNLTTDAHLAAIAISQGATLVSCDADFGRYKHLRWENPLHA